MEDAYPLVSPMKGADHVDESGMWVLTVFIIQ